MLNISAEPKEWQHPKELLKLQKLRIKKQALQRRICGNSSNFHIPNSPQGTTNFTEVFRAQKRKNPFKIEQTESKIQKTNRDFLSEDTDHTLFKLFNNNDRNVLKKVNSTNTVTNFLNILSSQQSAVEEPRPRTNKTNFCPIDWTLKRQIRLISAQPFQWSQKLKISEESSGITSFTRCLDMEKCETTLDVSPNAKFHQCCLYWQHPVLPWLDLFPRNKLKKMNSLVNLEHCIKQSLYEQWTDSLKSLFQLIRTRQCPYFYVCANTFTALFRAAGISGFSDLHVMITPTTRGLRKLLKNDDIEFEMPLKVAKTEETEENDGQHLDEDWLQDLGVDEASIKSINMTQGQILHQTECEIDSTTESLILIKGVEVNSFFNFLLNCKSIISPTGPLAGIPPTLFAPVAFFGATLNALKVKESKIHLDGVDFNSMELSGPILPSIIQNIFYINNNKNNLTMTFNDLESTRSFSRIKGDYLDKSESKSNCEAIFGKENLSDCGLNAQILNSFCSTEKDNVKNIECVKITKENGLFSWS